jgi:hypothetical protein
MKKILLPLFILIILAFKGYAQTDPPVLMDLGATLGSTSGTASSTFSSVEGITIKVEFPFTGARTYFTATTGIAVFNLKSTYALDTTRQSAHYVPLELGIKQFLYKGIYIEGDIGESFNINSNYLGYQSGFMYSPAVGFSLPLKQANQFVDFNLKYEGRLEQGGSINQIAFGIAYKFGL